MVGRQSHRSSKTFSLVFGLFVASNTYNVCSFSFNRITHLHSRALPLSALDRRRSLTIGISSQHTNDTTEVEETGSRKSSNKSTVNSKSKELSKRKSLVLSMSSIDEDVLTTDSENSNSLYTSKKQRQLMVVKVNEKANSIIDMESITSVVSASFVITSNTVGAGMLCLPEAAASPIGMFPALIVFFGE